MIVTLCGYVATGSSAVFDLLREYEGLTTGVIDNALYEHLVFLTPGGLFDLEDRLIVGNNRHHSDAALHTFVEEMDRLNRGDFRWCGNLSAITNGEFEVIYRRFVDSLIDCIVDAHWSYHLLPADNAARMDKTGFVNRLRKRLAPNPSKPKRQRYRYKDGIWYSFVTPERFYKLGHQFVMDYLSCIAGGKSGDLLVNKMVLPHNLKRLERYHLSDIRTIVVDRDPRDVYCFINQIKRTQIPKTPEDFIKYWTWQRSSEVIVEKNVLRIRFEDLVYRYDDTVAEIEQFLGLSPAQHVRLREFFNPDVSRKNTRLFTAPDINQEHIALIADSLEQHLYPFPLNVDSGTRSAD